MQYSAATQARLKAIAKEQNLSLAQINKVFDADRASSGHNIETQLRYLDANPSHFTNLVDGYNTAHPATPLVAGAHKRQQLIIAAVVVVALLVGSYFLYQKLKK